MRGRKPKPISVQIAEGDPSKKGVRKLKAKLAGEPKAVRGLPECPQQLQGRARQAWKFWREELEGMGIDRRPDSMMLEGACVNYARAVEADRILAEEGLIVSELAIPKDCEVPVVMKRKMHPAITVSNAAWRQVRAFCSEFGLSPVSRTRLAIERKEDDTAELAKLLMQPRVSKQPVTVQ